MAVLFMWLNVIQATLNTRQCWPAVSTTNRMWGGPKLQQGFSNYCTVLSQKPIILLTFPLRAVALAVLPPVPSPLWMFFCASLH